jgi:hypothetical protein
MTGIPKQWRSNTCSCGSGKPKSAQYDARGIFLTYTCEDCHDRKMAGYRPDVLTDPRSQRRSAPIPESFKSVQHGGFVDALPETDYTAKMLLA